MKILLLGTGLQGKAALHDLVQSDDVAHVIAADVNIQDLEAYVARLGTDKVTPVALDVHDRDRVMALMRQVDAVIVLLPVKFHALVGEMAVESGIHLVNASYPPPEFQSLGERAAAKGLAILPEFGLDPGIDLVLAGQAVREFDEVQAYFSYGGGVPEPKAANNPIKYKISWTFEGVLKSYRRPARIVRDGQVVDIPDTEIFAEENIHLVEVEGVGQMEAFPNGDALKYLEMLGISTTVRNGGRFATRWPGHCAFWKKLVDLHFLDEEPIRVGDAWVSPRQFVHDLLAPQPQLHYKDDERDLVVVRVDVRGLRDGERKRVVYQVVDWRDLKTGLLAMQRTVGYTASIGAQMILRGDIRKRGLLSPLKDVPADVFFAELCKRGISVQRMEMPWEL